MGYLVLARREGETITLRAKPGADPADLLASFLVDGITVELAEIDGSRVKLAIEAPKAIEIMRAELAES